MSPIWKVLDRLLTPAVDGCDGMEDTVVCWVATEDDRCCGSTVVLACL